MLIMILIIFGLSVIFGCRTGTKLNAEYVKKPIKLGEGLRIKPPPFKTSPFSSNEQCMNGNYIYVYETDSGLHGREVWLCCVPPEELLQDSFACASGMLVLPYIGDEDYIKVRYCNVIDALSSEVVYIPVCIPAPISTDDETEKYEGLGETGGRP